MKPKYILALDQGTTSSRAVLFNSRCEIVSMSQRPFNQQFPQPGWVEHNPLEIWSTQSFVMENVVNKADIEWSDIEALGITNQRETTVVWDRQTSEPVYNAIVWQDRRTADYCDALRERGLTERIREKTGLILDAYFSATKIRWILDNVPGAHARAERGELCFGTVDSWLAWRLSGGRLHITDVSNASRTMLFDIHTLDWDDELLDLFDIPRSMLPEVVPTSAVYGTTDCPQVPVPIPIASLAGDQQAALFGQQCIAPFSAKTTYGTGCFIMLNTGDRPHASANNLLATVAWQLGGKTTYALEGSVFVGGSVIQWLRDGLKLFSSSADSEPLAASVEDTGGVYLVPALTGLGAPYWDPYARGTIVGITRGTTSAHITRAALEAIAFEVDDVVRAMAADTGHTSTEMRVDGGAVANSLLMQFQADLTGVRIIRPSVMESTALGAAMFAGLPHLLTRSRSGTHGTTPQTLARGRAPQPALGRRVTTTVKTTRHDTCSGRIHRNRRDAASGHRRLRKRFTGPHQRQRRGVDRRHRHLGDGRLHRSGDRRSVQRRTPQSFGHAGLRRDGAVPVERRAGLRARPDAGRCGGRAGHMALLPSPFRSGREPRHHSRRFLHRPRRPQPGIESIE